ncbi:hypothetical protein [Sporocytophaga myxococcoides]|uniref:hypothetical protein n=1 Tax=Sporocytophaga myxococcoides TaxID=153721 RepID=UPI00040B8779|nr:hypothetical protein [Sporocytophaga myxococcoides]
MNKVEKRFPLQKVSHDLLDFWENNLQAFKNDPSVKEPDLCIAYYMAQYTLIHFFGPNWSENNVQLKYLPKLGKLEVNLFDQPWKTPTIKVKNNFLYVFPLNKEEEIKHQNRVIDLAEMLFNLQNIEGIEEVFKLISNGDIEANYAVLQGAKLLCLSKQNFYFVKPQGEKRKDYDTKICLANGEILYCEMKSKLEKTGLTKGTILNTLIDARKQLPENSPGVIFLGYPGSWLGINDLPDMLGKAINEFLRTTKRIVALIIFVDEWQYIEKKVIRILTSNEIVNTNSPHYTKIPIEGILPSYNSNLSNYRSFIRTSPITPLDGPYFLIPMDEN